MFAGWPLHLWATAWRRRAGRDAALEQLRAENRQLRHSLLSGLIMVAALSIGEFNLSNLLTVMQTQTYPVALLQAFYGATGFACAATVLLLVLASLASLLSSSTVKPV